jgi:hypothetical protein
MTRPTRLKIALYAGVAAVSLTTCVAWKQPATFSVVAVAERVEIDLDYLNQPEWFVRQAVLADSVAPRRRYTGSIRWGEDVTLAVTRISLGDLMVVAKSNKTTPVAWFADSAGSFQPVHHWVMLLIDSVPEMSERGLAAVFPIVGKIGMPSHNSLQLAQRPGVREGSLRIIANAILRRERVPYLADNIELESGSYLQLVKPTGTAYGTIMVDERPGMTVVYRARASGAMLAGTGGLGYTARLRLYSVLTRDPTILFLALIFSIVVAVLSLFPESKGT